MARSRAAATSPVIDPVGGLGVAAGASEATLAIAPDFSRRRNAGYSDPYDTPHRKPSVSLKRFFSSYPCSGWSFSNPRTASSSTTNSLKRQSIYRLDISRCSMPEGSGPVKSGRARPVCTRDRADVVGHVLGADLEGVVVAEHDHRDGIADEDEVDARGVGDPGRRCVVGRDHHEWRRAAFGRGDRGGGHAARGCGRLGHRLTSTVQGSNGSRRQPGEYPARVTPTSRVVVSSAGVAPSVELVALEVVPVALEADLDDVPRDLRVGGFQALELGG